MTFTTQPPKSFGYCIQLIVAGCQIEDVCDIEKLKKMVQHSVLFSGDPAIGEPIIRRSGVGTDKEGYTIIQILEKGYVILNSIDQLGCFYLDMLISQPRKDYIIGKFADSIFQPLEISRTGASERKPIYDPTMGSEAVISRIAL